jgi:hypothetical protein
MGSVGAVSLTRTGLRIANRYKLMPPTGPQEIIVNNPHIVRLASGVFETNPAQAPTSEVMPPDPGPLPTDHGCISGELNDCSTKD